MRSTSASTSIHLSLSTITAMVQRSTISGRRATQSMHQDSTTGNATPKATELTSMYSTMRTPMNTTERSEGLESHTCGFRLISTESRTTSRSSQKTRLESHSIKDKTRIPRVLPSLQPRTCTTFVTQTELQMKLSVKISQFSAHPQMIP